MQYILYYQLQYCVKILLPFSVTTLRILPLSLSTVISYTVPHTFDNLVENYIYKPAINNSEDHRGN